MPRVTKRCFLNLFFFIFIFSFTFVSKESFGVKGDLIDLLIAT